MGDIWTPIVGYIHLKGPVEKITQVVYIERKTSPTLSADLESLHPCESYSGTDNPLHFKTVNVAEFTCGFDNITENYPFGRQNCDMSFFITKNDNSLTNLTVDSLVNLGPATSGQFVISGWSMMSEMMENNNGKVITVHLGVRRNFLREDFNKNN